MHGIERRAFLLGAGALGAGAAGAPTPDSVHRGLVAGNLRFLGGRANHPHSSARWARETARHAQHPHAAILCCSDSRVAPEILFDQGLGDLFTVRVAGNVMREDEIGSLEYAVGHLHVPLIVILGHTGCGAVRAVVDGEEMPEEIDHLVGPIREAVGAVRDRRPGLGAAELTDEAVRLHAATSRRTLLAAHAEFAKEVQAGRLRIEAAVYELATGRVRWLTA
jgi:carbonic anhydrase